MTNSNLPKIPYLVLTHAEVVAMSSADTFFKEFGISNAQELTDMLGGLPIGKPTSHDTFDGLITVVMRNKNICIGRMGDFTWGHILESRDGGSEIILAKKANVWERNKYNSAMGKSPAAEVMAPAFDKEWGTQLVLDQGNGKYILHDGPILITMECGKMGDPEQFLLFGRYSLALEDVLDRHRKS